MLFVAGEASGDLHAAGVARELRERGAPYRLVGIGGDSMREAGVELIEHVEGGCEKLVKGEVTPDQMWEGRLAACELNCAKPGRARLRCKGHSNPRRDSTRKPACA